MVFVLVVVVVRDNVCLAEEDEEGVGYNYPAARLTSLPCGATTLTPGSREVLQSPNFPSNYDVDYRLVVHFSTTYWNIFYNQNLRL